MQADHALSVARHSRILTTVATTGGLPQPSWKIVVLSLGTQEIVLEADLCADNWLAALRAGRDQLGDPGSVPAGASCVVAESGEVSILDAANRRRYVLTPSTLAEEQEQSRRPPPRPSRAPQIVDAGESPTEIAAKAASAGEDARERATSAADAPEASAADAETSTSPRQQQTLAYSAQRADALRREYESSRTRSSAPPGERGNLRAVPAVEPPGGRSIPPAPKVDPRLLKVRSARPPRASSPGSADVKLVPAFARDMDPTPKSPITYRERAFLITPPGEVSDLEGLMQAELLKLRAELSSSPRGQLIHLAAFDKPFRGAPNEPPIATLEWSDWRGNAVFVSHAEAAPPARANEASAVAGDIPAHGSHVAPIPRAPASEPSPSAPAAAPAKSTTGKLAWEKLRKATATNSEARPSEPTRPPGPAASEAPPSVPPGAPPGEPTHAAAAPSAPVPLPAALPWMNASLPPSQPAPSASPIDVPPAFRTGGHKALRDDTGEVDNRLAQAFEALTDLYFLGTPVSGIEFATQLISRLVPCEAISVCLYDINTDEYRFVAVGGPNADERRASAIPSSVGLFGAARWTIEDALVVANVAADARYQPAFDGRGELEMLNLCYVPLRKNGQLLGMVQLINRAGDLGFTAADIAVLHYIANQLGDFISQRRSLVG